MIARVITGGQTGADQAGWRAARRFGISTGGWMPADFLVEDETGWGFDRRPEFAEKFGAKAHSSPLFRDRTRENVRQSNGMLWFGSQSSPGWRCTTLACGHLSVPWMPVKFDRRTKPEAKARQVAMLWPEMYAKNDAKFVLMVAGNRESSYPGIGAWTESFLWDLFLHLGYKESD